MGKPIGRISNSSNQIALLIEKMMDMVTENGKMRSAVGDMMMRSTVLDGPGQSSGSRLPPPTPPSLGFESSNEERNMGPFQSVNRWLDPIEIMKEYHQELES
ncbi:hypothetical protein L1887_14446 [Cichorium endivia]|nr:hypothetical protein L1887_14446 [Cichorium endivia]